MSACVVRCVATRAERRNAPGSRSAEWIAVFEKFAARFNIISHPQKFAAFLVAGGCKSRRSGTTAGGPVETGREMLRVLHSGVFGVKPAEDAVWRAKRNHVSAGIQHINPAQNLDLNPQHLQTAKIFKLIWSVRHSLMLFSF